MPSVADLLGLSNSIEFEGKTYQLRPPTPLEEAQFSRWLESRAREAAGRATDLPEEMQDKLLQAVTRDVAAGVYDFEGEAAAVALTQPLGMAKILHLVIGSTDPEFRFEDARRMVRTALKEVAAVLVGKATTDPQVLAFVLRTLGLPADFLARPSAASSSASATPPSADPPTSPP